MARTLNRWLYEAGMRYLLFGLLTVLSNMALAECPALKLPSEFTANEVFFTIGTDMILADRTGNEVGRVIERVVNLTRTFEVYNAESQLVGRTKERFFSWGVTVDLMDCEANKVGTIREEVFVSLLKVFTRYSIFDANDHVVAKSIKQDFLSVNFSIRDPDQDLLAHMHKPWFQWFTHSWDIKLEKNTLNPLFFAVIPAYKTAADRARARNSSDTDSGSISRSASAETLN